MLVRGGSHIFEIKITEVTSLGEILTLSEHRILLNALYSDPCRALPRHCHVIVPPNLKCMEEAVKLLFQEHLSASSQHIVSFAHINAYKNSLQAWAFLTSS